MTSQKVAMRRGAALITVLMAVLTAVAMLAPSAGAVVVQVGPHQRAGVMPARGVNPASIRGSYAKPGAAKKFAANGNLDYNGGIVLHGEAPYLIFWDPNNQIAAADKALYERFFADSAHDSGLATNVYSVDRQFTDSTGFANYSQTWDPSHAITDTQAYPTTGQCTESSFSGETACLFDAQIQAEVARVIAADSLPSGETGQAPIYFVVTPPTVNSCFSDGTTCADNFFCAYHSGFTNGSSQVLYADMATILDANDPKGCQFDNNSAVQEPNGRPIADVNIKAMSHEFNETITDPNGDAWWNSTTSGNEDGDNCNFYGSTVDPNNSSNPNAFTPTLGGSASLGTLFNQVMNGNPYYTQSEWSNGNVNCEMRPATATLSPAFTASTATTGSPVTFNPTSSSSTAGYSSTGWDFGDGTSSFSRSAPASISHTYAAAGTYTATLTTVDRYGNLSTVSHSVQVAGAPTAAFTVTSASPTAGSGVSFDGSGSSAPSGSISSYSWSFGDGSAAGSGVTTSHTYATAGSYTVTLTVTDTQGRTGSVSHAVSVAAIPPPPPAGKPTAVITVGSATPTAGQADSFSGAHSSDVGSSISSYHWSFGDGGTGTGQSVSHVYSHTGPFTVTLTVTDATGATASTTTTVNAVSATITSVSVKKGKKIEKLTLIISGPGTLTVGKRKFTIKQAGSFVYKLKLSKSQRNRLKHHHSLKIKVTFKFQPTVGSSSTRTVRFKVKG